MAQSSRWSDLQAAGSLLRMIAGLEDITGGTVSIGGPAGERSRAEGARHRDGVPELCVIRT
jgi:hypothetical protein